MLMRRGGRTVADTTGRRVSEDAVFVEVGESVCLRGECWWKRLEECGVVDRLDVDEIEDLKMSS